MAGMFANWSLKKAQTASFSQAGMIDQGSFWQFPGVMRGYRGVEEGANWK
jgi:hypothetical protein